MDKEKILKRYKTDDLIVYWLPEKCTHACTCWRSLPEVFNPRVKPWIDVTGAAAEKIIETIDRCPSGALKYELPEGSSVDPASAKGPGLLSE